MSAPAPTWGASKTHAITPADATDLSALTLRAVRVIAAGNVSLKLREDTAYTVYTAVPAYTQFNDQVVGVGTATTATVVGLS